MSLRVLLLVTVIAATAAPETQPPTLLDTTLLDTTLLDTTSLDTTLLDTTLLDTTLLDDTTVSTNVIQNTMSVCDTVCGEANTLCKYHGQNKAACSAQVGNTGPGKLDERSPFDWREGRDILKKHNDLRRRTKYGEPPCYPGAINMSDLTWSRDLARIADRWATQCTTGEDECRMLPNGAEVGQNVAEGFFPDGFNDKFHLDVIDVWYNERRLFPPAFIDPYQNPKGKMTKHYTQMVWSTTTEVGCARAYYGSGTQTIVCNYSPAGNIRGKAVYWRTPEDYYTCSIEVVTEVPPVDAWNNYAARSTRSMFMFAVSFIFTVKHCDLLPKF